MYGSLSGHDHAELLSLIVLKYLLSIISCILSLPERFRDEVEITPDDRHDITEVDTDYTLTIKDVTEEDDAEYTVVLTNPAGSVSSSAEILVNLVGKS